MTMHPNPFKHEISQLILEALGSDSIELSTVYGLLSSPPDFSLGQVAFPCFVLAKSLKKPPAQIAQTIAQAINNRAEKTYVKSSAAMGAYVNFLCNFTALLAFERGRDFSKNSLKPQHCEKIIVEYSQPNTHKTLHVGHLRCLVLGDAVCNILEYVGNTVVRVTYPGDIGTHVAKVIWYLTHPSLKALPTHNKAQWLGEMYANADAALKSVQGTQDEKEAKKHFTAILKQLSEGHGEYFDLWAKTREWSLDYLKHVYEWLQCRFDIWFFESEFDKPSKEFVLQKFKEGFFVQDQGAIGIDLKPYNLGFAMYLKSDGNGLYITKDLLLLVKKFSDPDVTKSIYVVDARQKQHFEQLFKTAELMGHPQAGHSYHLSYETVNTETGEPFSSRALKGLEIFELKNKMEEKIKENYLARYRGEWSDADIETTARTVCVGALKYGLLRSDNNTQIHFSLSEWLKLDGDTGPYLQYVHARCCSILAKIQKPRDDTHLQGDILVHESEQELLFFIHRFPEFCLQSAEHLKPSIIATYLHDLAKLFNRFYEFCPIMKSEKHVLETRLELVELTKKTICTGLKLLGIQSPEKM